MPKNILLFMTDQQRADYVGYIPGGKAVMPTLDKIAGHAYFTCCQSTNPICTPARTSLITGRYSRQIGTLTMSGDLYPQIPTFMQALRNAGYRSYGIGKYHYLQTAPWDVGRGNGMRQFDQAGSMRDFGYDFVWESAGKQQLVTSHCFYAEYLRERGLLEDVRDFYQRSGGGNGDTADHNYDQANPWPFSEEDYIDVVTARVACDALRVHDADTPFYMMVSFCGPHKPYDAPSRYLDMFPLEREDDFIPQDGTRTMTAEQKETLYRQRRSAKAMLRLIDDQMARVLDVLAQRGMLDETMIIFTSDHGDMLGDHFMIQKGCPWRAALNVPLAVSVPGLAPVGECASPVELSDIAATILDYAGLDAHAALSRSWPAYNDVIPSRSLMPVLCGEKAAIRSFTYSERDFTEERGPDATAQGIVQNRGGAGRSNAWQCITTAATKYIKYLGYGPEERPVEEFYDLLHDPHERDNLIADPQRREEIEQARLRVMYVLDHYPPAQKCWAGYAGKGREDVRR